MTGLRTMIQDLRAKLCDDINTAGLPPAVAELVVLDVYNELRAVAIAEDKKEDKKGDGDDEHHDS